MENSPVVEKRKKEVNYLSHKKKGGIDSILQLRRGASTGKTMGS